MNNRRSVKKRIIYFTLVLLASHAPLTALAQKVYTPGKVVYDISSADAQLLSHMLDRASLLQRIYQNDSFNASIVFIIHEGAVPLFVKTRSMHRALMQRASSLTMGEIIQFKLCQASVSMQGFKATDFYDFVEMVPMADAELIELQDNGYAYMR